MMKQEMLLQALRSRTVVTFALAATLLVPVGCKKQAVVLDDTSLNAAVQSRIQADSAISTEPIQLTTTAGTVVLSGQVSSSAARTLAADDAANVTGVKKVINNLTVAETAPAMAKTGEKAGREPRAESSERTRARVESRPAPITTPRLAPAPTVQPAPIERAQAAQTPPPPSFRTVTVPAGTVLPVRITQTLDSETAHAGDTFSGALATDLVQDGLIALPRGSAVSGRVVDAKDAGHFKGSSLLTIELTSVSRRGQQIAISTDPFSKQGAGRGKNTAVKAGVGAAAGAVLGGIFGGGKGAAIGAAAGGGTGAGINAVTRGQQVQIPSETVVRFSTTNSFTARVSTNQTASSTDGNNGFGNPNQ